MNVLTDLTLGDGLIYDKNDRIGLRKRFSILLVILKGGDSTLLPRTMSSY